MPTPNNQVSLTIGDRIHTDWSSYSVDSNLLVPADAWHVSLGLDESSLPAFIRKGEKVEIRVGGELVMVSRIDDVIDEARKDSLHVDITGRDAAAVLLDCSAPVFTAKMASLKEIVAKIVVPLGIPENKIRISADAARVREKINIEPGDSAWQVLTHVAEANGFWAWIDPDGTLVIGGPDYSLPIVATLILRNNGRGNNVNHIRREDSIRGRYSEVTVLGQAHGTTYDPGKHDIKSSWKDESVSWYRPRIVIDHEADSVAVAKDRARKLLADSRLRGFSLVAEVDGHRIVAPGQASDGALWMPGQRIHVISERHAIDGVYFLMARRFSGGRNATPKTTLTLKEDKAWVLDAHPHKRKHRLGRNAAPLQILDASTGASS